MIASLSQPVVSNLPDAPVIALQRHRYLLGSVGRYATARHFAS
jgi:hypothetical protein